jgi:hypothetical protein
MKTIMKALLPGLALLAACSSEEVPAQKERLRLGQTSQALSVIPRGSSCAQLGMGNQQLTLPGPVAAGRHAIDGQNGLTLGYYDDTNTVFYFTNSSIRMTAVMVSNGDRTLLWDMPEGQTGYGSLHGPSDPSTGFLSTPEEVTFCYDYELRVQPSPYAFHAQRPSWTITKSGPTSRLVLAEGQDEEVEYDVTVSPGSPTAAGQYVSGPVYVTNGSPHTVTVSTLSTTVGTEHATITCPTALPFNLAPFATRVCEFRADLPDTSDRNVIGGGSVSHGLAVKTREVMASFGAHNVSTDVVDECVKVTDTAAPYNDNFLGTACVNEGTKSFHFSALAGPFACGPFTLSSTATYVGLETGATASVGWTSAGEVQCNPGCTLGAPYWRNHTQASPRRYNPTWNQVGPQGELTPFFNSGGTWLHAVTRPIAGNAYWTLSRAYIAATLNKLNGARMSPANQASYDAAKNLFLTYTPAQVDAHKPTRKLFAKAAAELKDFNSGRTGPGRCTSKPDLSDDGDEDHVCTPGAVEACYSGPAGTSGVGLCAAGSRTCNATGTAFSDCIGSVTPTNETCGDGIDNDCDGTVDEGCICAPSSASACYSGPPGTEGVGACRAGAQQCNSAGTAYGACEGSVGPSAEVCGDGIDNDCDGQTDEGCVCTPNAVESCYSGPAGTAGVGSCRAGTRSCDATGSAWSACTGSVTPSADVCGDGVDNDCDGATDETCVCAANSTQSCYAGPAGTAGVGACRAGTRSCNTDGTAYGACTGSITPGAEVCGDGIDNDCDGQIDEGCLGNYAWNDRNRNGIQDAGELGLGGATYILRTSSGAVVSVTVSAASGAYWFTNIPPGDYYVEVIPPFMYTLSPANVGSDDNTDNDFDGETGSTDIFHYNGSSTGHVDSGFYFVIQS